MGCSHLYCVVDLERTIIAIVIANVIVLVRGLQITATVIAIVNVIAISFSSSQYMKKGGKNGKKICNNHTFLRSETSAGQKESILF